MKYALLNLLPPHFDGIVNELRASPHLSWRYVESRVVDYDKSTKQGKAEVQGAVYQVAETQSKRQRARLGPKKREQESEELQADQVGELVEKVNALLAQNKRRPSNLRCWGCGGRGHREADCKKKRRAPHVQNPTKERHES